MRQILVKVLSHAACVALIGAAIVLYLLACGMMAGEWWATDFWPIRYSESMSFMLLAAFLAAAASSILWVGLTREWGALVGIGIEAMAMGGPVAIYGLRSKLLSLLTLGDEFRWLGLAGLVLTLIGSIFRLHKPQKTPAGVYWSFVVLVVVLLGSGVAMVCGGQNILPWNTQPTAVVIYGWMFIGAGAYLLYGVCLPRWSNAAGQLLGLLAYDLVLIGPIILSFKTVPANLLPNLIVYAAVVVFSGVLAVYYCFVRAETRVLRKSVQRESAGLVQR